MDTDKSSRTGDIAFSPETEAEFQKLLKRYPDRQACVLPALFLCQEEFGYVSVQSMEYVAQRLDVPPAKVLSVATFYTMFRRHPVGEHHISVCTGPPCALVGSDRVLRFFEERLGVKVGQTTPDKKFTLERSECLASCGTAPMLECDGHYHENLTEERLEELLAEWSKNGS